MALVEPFQLVFHLTFVQTLHGQTIQNGYYFTNNNQWNDALTAFELNNKITFFRTQVLPSIKAIQSQEVVHKTLIMAQLFPHNGPIVEQILETSGGDQTFESLPSYCAAVLSLRSGFGGKSNRGRSYYAGISVEHGNGSLVELNILAGLQDIGNKLLTNFGNSSSPTALRYCIYSRKLGDQEQGRPTAGGLIPIVQCLARRTLGTQRHRKIGIGN